MGRHSLCVPKADIQIARKVLKGHSASLFIKERHTRWVSGELREDNNRQVIQQI